MSSMFYDPDIHKKVHEQLTLGQNYEEAIAVKVPLGDLKLGVREAGYKPQHQKFIPVEKIDYKVGDEVAGEIGGVSENWRGKVIALENVKVKEWVGVADEWKYEKNPKGHWKEVNEARVKVHWQERETHEDKKVRANPALLTKAEQLRPLRLVKRTEPIDTDRNRLDMAARSLSAVIKSKNQDTIKTGKGSTIHFDVKSRVLTFHGPNSELKFKATATDRGWDVDYKANRLTKPEVNKMMEYRRQLETDKSAEKAR